MIKRLLLASLCGKIIHIRGSVKKGFPKSLHHHMSHSFNGIFLNFMTATLKQDSMGLCCNNISTAVLSAVYYRFPCMMVALTEKVCIKFSP